MSARLSVKGPRACVAMMLISVAACGDDGGTGGSSTTSPTTSAPVSATATSGTTTSTTTSATQSTSTSTTASASSTGAMAFTSIGKSSFETQATLAADAAGNVVVAWVAVDADGTSAIGYAISRDGGASFTAPAYAAAPDGRLSSSPSIAVDAGGTVTLVWLGFRLDFAAPDEHVYAARLGAGATFFEAPVPVSDDGSSTTTDYDRPSVVHDADGDVLVVYSDFTGTAQGGPAATRFARSSNGTTFTRTLVAADATFGNLAYLCLDPTLGPSAPLYLVHLGAGGTVTLRRSDDRGASWDDGNDVGATEVVFQPPTCVARGNVVDVAYAAGLTPFSPGDESPGDRVSVSTSIDGGVTFAPPSTVTDKSPAQYLYPRITRAANDRVVTFYQGTVGNPAMLVEATSGDGVSWTRASIAPAGTFTIDLALASWLGGQTGLAVPGANGFVAYAENTQNKTHVAFAEVALP